MAYTTEPGAPTERRDRKANTRRLAQSRHRHYNSPLGGSLAQSVEHCTFNAVVIGSNPIRPTIKFKDLGSPRRAFVFCKCVVSANQQKRLAPERFFWAASTNCRPLFQPIRLRWDGDALLNCSIRPRTIVFRLVCCWSRGCRRMSHGSGVTWSRFNEHTVKPLGPVGLVFQIRPGSNSPNTTAVECCCAAS